MLPLAMTIGASSFYFVAGPLTLPFDRGLAVVISIPVALALLVCMVYWRGLLRARLIIQWPIAAAIWVCCLFFWRWFMYGL